MNASNASSTDLNGLRQLAEELREYTAMKYAGDCKCGKCQLVPRPLVERLYHTLNSYGGAAQAAPEPLPVAAWQRRNIGKDGTPFSNWYLADDGPPTPEKCAWDGYLSYEYRPLYAAPQPANKDELG